MTRQHITARKKTVKKIEIYAVFHQKKAVFCVLRKLFVTYEKYSYVKTPEKRQKLKLFKSRIFPKTQKNMRNIKNMTLFCQIQSKTIISPRLYTNNYRKYIFIAKTLFGKNQQKSSKNHAFSAKKAQKNYITKNIRVKTALNQA